MKRSAWARGCGNEHDHARCRYQYAETGVFQIPASDAKTVAEMIDVREAQFRADGYKAWIDYQASAIAAKRVMEGDVIKPQDLVGAP